MDMTTVSKARRRWSVAEKIRIVQESSVAGASVSLVARANDVNANQVFLWRRQFQNVLLGPAKSESSLLPVRITRNIAAVATPARKDAAATTGSILIELASARLRIEGSVDRATLLTVLEVLHS